jgi:hypothetical protein
MVVSLHSDMFDLLQCAILCSFFNQDVKRCLFQYLKIRPVLSSLRTWVAHHLTLRGDKFIEIPYFWFKEYLEGRFAKLDYLRSEDHPVVDLLASVRSGAEFKHFTNLIMETI